MNERACDQDLNTIQLVFGIEFRLVGPFVILHDELLRRKQWQAQPVSLAQAFRSL